MPRYARPSAALVVALLAVGAWTVLPVPDRGADGSGGASAQAYPAVTDEWPGTVPTELYGQFFDGAEYRPLLFLDDITSVGTSPSVDGKHNRLILYAPGTEPTIVAALPSDEAPGFTSVAATGDTLVWTETVADSEGVAESTVWSIGVDDGSVDGDPRKLTGDTGDMMFAGSAYDVQIATHADGTRHVHWASSARTAEPVTEFRSIPLDGGEVTTEEVPGAFTASRWPYVISTGGTESGGSALLNLDSGVESQIPVQQGELATCTPAWCRVLRLGGDGPSGTDLMRPDGAERRSIADQEMSAAVPDPMMLDRFEILIDVGSPDGTGGQPLLMFDVARGKTVAIAKDANVIQARDGFVWWSTGEQETLTWWALNLNRLE